MCKRDNSLISYVVISPEAEIHRHILLRSITLIPLDFFFIIFGRNEEEDQ